MPKRKTKSKRVTEYSKALKGLIANKTEVEGYKFDRKVKDIIHEDEFVQLYRPKEKPWSEFPKYWFISREGYLLSLENVNKPKFLKVSLSSNRPCYAFKLNGKKKNFQVYILTALAYGSYISPGAMKLLKHEGLKVIGASPKEDENGHIDARVQFHHISEKGYLKDGTEESFILNNRPGNVQAITNKEHIIVGHISGDIEKDTRRLNTSKYNSTPDENITVYTYKSVNTVSKEEKEERQVLDIKDIDLNSISIEKVILSNKPMKRIEKIGKKSYYAMNFLNIVLLFESYSDREYFINKVNRQKEEGLMYLNMIKLFIESDDSSCEFAEGHYKFIGYKRTQESTS